MGSASQPRILCRRSPRYTSRRRPFPPKCSLPRASQSRVSDPQKKVVSRRHRRPHNQVRALHVRYAHVTTTTVLAERRAALGACIGQNRGLDRTPAKERKCQSSRGNYIRTAGLCPPHRPSPLAPCSHPAMTLHHHRSAPLWSEPCESNQRYPLAPDGPPNGYPAIVTCLLSEGHPRNDQTDGPRLGRCRCP